MTTTNVADWLAATRGEADERAVLSRKHRTEADRLMAESLRLAVAGDALDESTRLHRQGIAEHGVANAHAVRALMLGAQADRVEAAQREQLAADVQPELFPLAGVA